MKRYPDGLSAADYRKFHRRILAMAFVGPYSGLKRYGDLDEGVYGLKTG